MPPDNSGRYAASLAVFLILDRISSTAFSQYRKAFSRSRASSYQTLSRFSFGGLLASTIRCIFVERFSTLVLLPNLHHFQAALRAPSTRNRVNEIAAQTAHFQCAGKCVGTALLMVLRRLIFENDNNVHGAVPVELKGIFLDSQRRSVGGIVRLSDLRGGLPSLNLYLSLPPSATP
jgi:hypothetical protein